jgi:hypothetical protein
LVRGASGAGADRRSYHFQVVAAAVGSQHPEQNLFQQISDIDTIENIRANRQDPNWVVLVFRGIRAARSPTAWDGSTTSLTLTSPAPLCSPPSARRTPR